MLPYPRKTQQAFCDGANLYRARSHVITTSTLDDSAFRQGSPAARDRFVWTRSPSSTERKRSSVNENTDNKAMFTGPHPASQSRGLKRPRILADKTLDAPGVSCIFPSKLIDINAQKIIATALDTSIYIWQDGNVSHLLSTDGSLIDGVCWTDGHLALSSGGHIELWDVEKSSVVQSFKDHKERVGALASSEGTLASGSDDGVVHISDKRSDRGQTMDAHHGAVIQLAWSLDGMTLASSGSDNSVSLWESRKRRKFEHEASVPGLVWMPSGTLITGQRSTDGPLHMFHRKSEIERVTQTDMGITGLCWSPQWGVIVAHDDEDGTWEIWSHDLTTRVCETHGHSQGILDIAYDATSDTVVTIAQDETLRIWQLSEMVQSVSNSTRPAKRRRPLSQYGGSAMISPVTLR